MALPLIPLAGLALSGAGLLQSARRGAQADRYQRRGLRLAEDDYRSRQPLRRRATSMLMEDQPQLPGFRRIDVGTANDYSGARGEIEGARIGGPSAAANETRQRTLGAVRGLSDGPGRTEIANQRFQNILDRAQETRKLGVEQIGQDAARLGRVGMGGVSTSLGNLENRIQTGITRAGRDLAADAAEGEISDRFNTANTLARIGGQFRGEDIDLDALRARLGLQRGGALANLGGQEFREGLTLRNEERGERGTERDFAQQDILNRLSHIDRLSQIGFTPPPTGAYNQAAGYANQQAGAGAQGSGALLGQILQMLQQRGN